MNTAVTAAMVAASASAATAANVSKDAADHPIFFDAGLGADSCFQLFDY